MADEIVSASDLAPQLEGDRVEKDDLQGKSIVVNLENMVEMDDNEKPFGIIQFTMDDNKGKEKKLYTTTAGGVPFKKFKKGKDEAVKKTRGQFVKTPKENKKKGEADWYWNFVDV